MKHNSARKRAAPGDILEISAPAGLAYVRYLGRHNVYGDAIWVFPHWQTIRPTNLDSVFTDDGYVTFYPAQSAIRQGLLDVVASRPLPSGCGVPTLLRREGFTSRDGIVLAWVIERDGKETLKHELDEEDRKLPIASIWNHEFLINRITDNWRPEQEG
jgi:hypothetical protein